MIYNLPKASDLRKFCENRDKINKLKATIINKLSDEELDTFSMNIDVMSYSDYVIGQVVIWLTSKGYKTAYDRGDSGHDGPYAWLHIEW